MCRPSFRYDLHNTIAFLQLHSKSSVSLKRDIIYVEDSYFWKKKWYYLNWRALVMLWVFKVFFRSLLKRINAWSQPRYSTQSIPNCWCFTERPVTAFYDFVRIQSNPNVRIVSPLSLSLSLSTLINLIKCQLSIFNCQLSIVPSSHHITRIVVRASAGELPRCQEKL